MLQDVQNKIPKQFKIQDVRRKLGDNVSPTAVVLLQELERFNLLTLNMTRSLTELSKVSGFSPRHALTMNFHFILVSSERWK